MKKIKKDDDLNKKEVKKAQRKVIKKWERNTEKNCVEYESASTCDAASKCVWMKDNTCVAKKALNAEYYDYDFMTKSYDVPKKVQKKLDSIKKDGDLTKKEVKEGAEEGRAEVGEEDREEVH